MANEYETCSKCKGDGLVKGYACGKCGGRGETKKRPWSK